MCKQTDLHAQMATLRLHACMQAYDLWCLGVFRGTFACNQLAFKGSPS